ncbi:MAG: class I tRNA ligase family protein, partial [Nanoarchaeota archaeon]
MKENDKIKWQPSWRRERMKAWLEGIGDWPISRERYWGTPLPIWVCEKCKERKVISGGDELERLSKKKIKDLHKPEIDNIFINCKCGGKMKRISAVLDVWFDSGVSSWAALNFPKDKKNFGKFWPADLNIEGMDQIRGWWNSQLILSEIAFGKSPMKFIAVHGMVLDLGKKKMSKSLGNFISPKDIISKYNRDFLRYYFAKVSKGDNFAYDEKDFAEIGNFFRVLDNVSAFISQLENQKKSKKIEDLWILSRLHSTIENSGKYYDDTKFFEAIREIELFLVEDLSKRYIKIIRDRTNEAGDTLKEIEKNVLLLIAPIAPFIAEKIWQKLRERKIVSEESIHLSSWPRHDAKKIDAKLEEDFANLLKVIETGLKERDCAKIGLKWPLASADITAKFNLNDEMKELVKNQLNVKKVFFNRVEKADTITVKLDVNMTPELEAEGFAREISRKVQALRKEAGLIKSDTISLILLVTDNLRQKIGSFEEFIKERTNSRKLEIANHSNIT